MRQQRRRPSLLQVPFPILFLVVAELLAKLLLLLSSVVALAACECAAGDQLPLESFVPQNLLHAPSSGCSSSPAAHQAAPELQLLVSSHELLVDPFLHHQSPPATILAIAHGSTKSQLEPCRSKIPPWQQLLGLVVYSCIQFVEAIGPLHSLQLVPMSNYSQLVSDDDYLYDKYKHIGDLDTDVAQWFRTWRLTQSDDEYCSDRHQHPNAQKAPLHCCIVC